MKGKTTAYIIIIGIICFFALILIKKTFTNLDNQPTQQKYPYIEFPNSNNQKFFVEIANTPEKRATGLMDRTQISEDYAMLFIFEDEEIRSFWMQNTYIPLDIIFLGSNQEIVTIHQNTKPLDTSKVYKSTNPAQYVIEIKAGLSNEYEIKEGHRVEFFL